MTSITTRGLTAAGLPAKVTTIPPNQTLYVTNLPSTKIRKEDLRTALYMLFSTHGHVLDVVALKTGKMRGQAHIVYRDIQTATQAMRSLEGFEFFGLKMKISYAKSKSNIISKLDGTFKMPTAAAPVEITDLQQSIFNAPLPGSVATGSSAVPPGPQSLPTKPGPDRAVSDAATPEGRGTKRARDEEDEEESDSDVAMEEDSDED